MAAYPETRRCAHNFAHIRETQLRASSWGTVVDKFKVDHSTLQIQEVPKEIIENFKRDMELLAAAYSRNCLAMYSSKDNQKQIEEVQSLFTKVTLQFAHLEELSKSRSFFIPPKDSFQCEMYKKIYKTLEDEIHALQPTKSPVKHDFRETIVAGLQRQVEAKNSSVPRSQPIPITKPRSNSFLQKFAAMSLSPPQGVNQQEKLATLSAKVFDLFTRVLKKGNVQNSEVRKLSQDVESVALNPEEKKLQELLKHVRHRLEVLDVLTRADFHQLESVQAMTKNLEAAYKQIIDQTGTSKLWSFFDCHRHYRRLQNWLEKNKSATLTLEQMEVVELLEACRIHLCNSMTVLLAKIQFLFPEWQEAEKYALTGETKDANLLKNFILKAIVKLSYFGCPDGEIKNLTPILNPCLIRIRLEPTPQLSEVLPYSMLRNREMNWTGRQVDEAAELLAELKKIAGVRGSDMSATLSSLEEEASLLKGTLPEEVSKIFAERWEQVKREQSIDMRERRRSPVPDKKDEAWLVPDLFVNPGQFNQDLVTLERHLERWGSFPVLTKEHILRLFFSFNKATLSGGIKTAGVRSKFKEVIARKDLMSSGELELAHSFEHYERLVVPKRLSPARLAYNVLTKKDLRGASFAKLKNMLIPLFLRSLLDVDVQAFPEVNLLPKIILSVLNSCEHGEKMIEDPELLSLLILFIAKKGAGLSGMFPLSSKLEEATWRPLSDMIIRAGKQCSELYKDSYFDRIVKVWLQKRLPELLYPSQPFQEGRKALTRCLEQLKTARDISSFAALHLSYDRELLRVQQSCSLLFPKEDYLSDLISRSVEGLYKHAEQQFWELPEVKKGIETGQRHVAGFVRGWEDPSFSFIINTDQLNEILPQIQEEGVPKQFKREFRERMFTLLPDFESCKGELMARSRHTNHAELAAKVLQFSAKLLVYRSGKHLVDDSNSYFLYDTAQWLRAEDPDFDQKMRWMKTLYESQSLRPKENCNFLLCIPQLSPEHLKQVTRGLQDIEQYSALCSLLVDNGYDDQAAIQLIGRAKETLLAYQRVLLECEKGKEAPFVDALCDKNFAEYAQSISQLFISLPVVIDGIEKYRELLWLNMGRFALSFKDILQKCPDQLLHQQLLDVYEELQECMDRAGGLE
jgi:hypothetical protein